MITNTEVTFECSHTYPNIIIPMWEIDGINYRVTDLPLGYEANGANLTFRVYNSTSIRCFFDAFNTSAGEFVVIYSNTVTITLSIGRSTYILRMTYLTHVTSLDHLFTSDARFNIASRTHALSR